MRVRFRQRAGQDVERAAQWYEGRLVGLGIRFISEIHRTVGQIAERPTSYPSVHRDVRRTLVSTFPFAVYYRLRDDDVVVIAVVHTTRQPRSWRQRT